MFFSTVILTGLLHIGWSGTEQPVTLAAHDLSADCGRVFGTPAEITASGRADITLAIDPQLQGAEAWRVVVSDTDVTITGSDALGLVYGVYQFSERCLGVDPMWFWKEVLPERRTKLELKPQTFSSSPSVFHYRGWFINDEDLLTDFGQSAGPRHIDYPFYAKVIDPAMAERIYEALLRCGGNLIIPASFVDVMNPPEAGLIQRAVARGLYVSQHHVEPVGVSHFTYENYWKARGQTKSFLYSTEPEGVKTVWKAYIQKWHELAGDHVIWQLGLRGRGDRPVWNADSGITPETGGAFITRAIADQWALIKSVDPRPQPAATSTLWSEGSQLMASGALKFPPGITLVFADLGPTQEWQDDFLHAPRVTEHHYGGYYHDAFWRNGPHLVPGVAPARVTGAVGALQARGDTEYAIINVSNVREHTLGGQLFIRAAMHGAGEPAKNDLADYAPASLHPLIAAYYAALPRYSDGGPAQDGKLVSLVMDFLAAVPKGNDAMRAALAHKGKALDYEQAAYALDRLETSVDWKSVPERWRTFGQNSYVIPGRFLAGLYRMSAALIDHPGDPAATREAVRHLDAALAARATLATGAWTGWFEGDKKANWPSSRQKLQAAAEQLAKLQLTPSP